MQRVEKARLENGYQFTLEANEFEIKYSNFDIIMAETDLFALVSYKLFRKIYWLRYQSMHQTSDLMALECYTLIQRRYEINYDKLMMYWMNSHVRTIDIHSPASELNSF